MTENFITNIFVENSRKVKDLEIPLSSELRQHLILTGKNGSGKTSLLLEINKFLTQIDNGQVQHFTNQKNQQERFEKQLSNSNNLTEEQRLILERQIKQAKDWFLKFGGTKISFSGLPYRKSILCCCSTSNSHI